MAGTVQNVSPAFPITALPDPPEGKKALPVNIVLTPTVTSFLTTINLQSSIISQIVTAIIDNTQSDVAISVIMGVTQTVVHVQANTGAIVPAFSNGPLFFLSVTAATTPGQTDNINITLLNYEKTEALWSFAPTTVITDIINTGLNSVPLNPEVLVPVGNGSLTVVATVGNWILDSLDLSVEGCSVTGAGQFGASLTLVCGSSTFAILFAQGTATGAGVVAGALVNNALQKTWANGLVLPRGNNITCTVANWLNMGSMIFRVNMSGYNAP